MELTLEDKARIEQAAIVYTEGHGSTHKNWRGFIDGYKAATIYERQQLHGGNEPDTVDFQAQHIEALKAERSELINLLRETVMRGRFAMPENEQDVEWFEEKRSSADLVEQIFKVLKLGKLNSLKTK